jgi:hypothetical protein
LDDKGPSDNIFEFSNLGIVPSDTRRPWSSIDFEPRSVTSPLSVTDVYEISTSRAVRVVNLQCVQVFDNRPEEELKEIE